MHILIDMQGAQNGSRHRGIGRYTRSLIQKLCELSLGKHRVSLLMNGAFDNLDEIKMLFSGYVHESDVHVWVPFGDPSFRWIGNDLRRKASEYLREAVIHEIAPDALIVSSTVEGCDDPTVVTINKHFTDTFTAAIFYDAIPGIYQDDYLADARSRQWYFEKIEQLQRADAIFSISQSSKMEAIDHFSIAEEKIVNISTAVSSDFCARSRTINPSSTILHEKSIGEKYILYSGASDVRKNIPRLIEAFSLLPAELKAKFKLVLAGGMPEAHEKDLRSYVSQFKLDNDQVIFTGWVNDEDLATIYAKATLFVFPSIHEGFGLPILEAMNYGVPVIGSDASSIPEVVSLPEALFDPLDARSICRKIEQALIDGSFRRRLVQNSERRRNAFSWESTARRALELLESVQERSMPIVCSKSDELHANHVLDILSSDVAHLHPDEIIEPIIKSLPQPRQRRQIFVDVSELHTRDSKTGIQRVVRNILVHLSKAVTINDVIVPVATTVDTEYRVSNKVGSRYIPSFITVEDPLPNFRAGDLFLGLDFQDVLVPRRAGFFDQIRSMGVACYFVIYDMLPLKLREHFPSQVAVNYNAWLNTVARSDGLIAISRSVADEVIHWMTETKLSLRKPVRIGHFRLGSDISSSSNVPLNAGLVAWLKLQKSARLFVTVGTIEPRKGHAQILSAMDKLWMRGEPHSLVVIGKKGWNCEDLIRRISEHPENGRRLLWLNNASDKDLITVLQAADALIAASEGEGYGLPIVEAQRLGLAVIARDLPVFREVAGDNATYFSGKSGNDLEQCISQWLETYQRPQYAAVSRVGFTWVDSANELSDILCRNKWYTTFL